MTAHETTCHDKLDFLLETCTREFITNCNFLAELVNWMSEDDFNEFYDVVCDRWGIYKSYEELAELDAD